MAHSCIGPNATKAKALPTRNNITIRYIFIKNSSASIMKQRRSTRNQIDGEAAGAATPLPVEPKGSAWKEKFVLFHPSTDTHYNLIVTLAFIDALVCLATETISPTAYGKFGADASIALPPQLGWWLMEIPVTLTLVYFFFIKGRNNSAVQCNIM